MSARTHCSFSNSTPQIAKPSRFVLPRMYAQCITRSYMGHNSDSWPILKWTKTFLQHNLQPTNHNVCAVSHDITLHV